MAHGGSRPRAGRKSNAELSKVRALLDTKEKQHMFSVLFSILSFCFQRPTAASRS